MHQGLAKLALAQAVDRERVILAGETGSTAGAGHAVRHLSRAGRASTTCQAVGLT